MRLEEFLAYLEGVQQNGQGHMALCPAHEDKIPSLSISEGEDGRILLHCHAGCSTEQIIATMGLRLSDLFFDSHAHSSANGSPRKAAPPPIGEAVVEQLHAAMTPKAREYLQRERMLSGEVIDRYQLGIEERDSERRITIPVRDEDRVIWDIRRWLPPEARKEGSAKMLHWKTGYGVPRLFPVDQLEYDKMVICEGEFDTLALISHDIPAVTLTAGCDTAPSLDQARLFTGKSGTLLMDHDTAGQRGALKRAEALAPYAREIKIASWPAKRTEGWDITDELRDHGVESLKAILEAAAPFEREESTTQTAEVEEEDKKKESPAAEIVKLVLQEAELFHDETRTPYARIEIRDHRENWRCESEGFSLWLQRRVFEEKGRPPSSEAIAQALGVIKGKALFEGAQNPLNLRTAWHEGALCYDLSDPAWRAVRITSQGWSICADPPILFTRYKHQAAQVDPVAGGDVRRLFEFVSVADEGARLLLLVWLVSCCIPGFPHPIPVLHGPQGSGKSSTFRTLRRLIDPSVMETLTFPRDVNELVQKLSHHWAALFDNVTGLSGWQSDALCRAVTGEGFSKRALYTNDEDHIYHFQRCIGLNGINIMATRADLLDRAILIGLERIAPQQRKTEEEMEVAFAEARPQILGGIFDTLVKAMRIKPTVKLAQLPRMADFARWGCAIAQALGYQAEDFLDAYKGNLQQQNREVLEGHPVAAAIMGLMEDRDAWEGEPAALLKALEEVAERKRITIKGHGWPGAAHILTRRLKEVKTNLQEAGVLLEEDRQKTRRLQVRKIATVATVATAPLQDNGLHVVASPTLLSVTSVATPVATASKPSKNNIPDASDASDATFPTQPGKDLRHVEV